MRVMTYFSFILVKFQIPSSIKSLKVNPALPYNANSIHDKTTFYEDLLWKKHSRFSEHSYVYYAVTELYNLKYCPL